MPSVRVRLRVWADAVGYALAVAAVAVVAAVVVGVATGGGLVRAKVLLFVGGWTLLAYATVRLWPRPTGNAESTADERGRSLPGTAEPTRFRAIVRSLPPLRWMGPPPPTRRLRPPAKLFLGAIFVLLASLVMEVAFGV